MSAKLVKKLDFFSKTPTLAFNGAKSYKTVLGGLTSMLSICLTVAVVVLFGQEVFLKNSPRVVSSEFSPDQSDMLTVNTANFTVFWSISDAFGRRVTDRSKQAVSPKIVYYDIGKNEEGRLRTRFRHVFSLKTCDQTKAVENPLLSNSSPELFYCLDFDEIQEKTGEQPQLGGYWDEDRIKYVSMEFSNCETDSEGNSLNCLEKEDFKAKLTESQYLNINTPGFYFDADALEEPLKPKLGVFNYLFSETLRRNDRAFFQLTYLFDDQGWLFSDSTAYLAASFSSMETALSVMSDSYLSRERVLVYAFNLYFNREQRRVKRSFMKLQELGALVGGVVKLLNTTLSVAVSIPVAYSVDCKLVDSLEGPKEKRSVSLSSNTQTPINLVRTKKNVRKISFYQYLKSLFVSKTPENQAFYALLDSAWRKLDMIQLLRMTEYLHKQAIDTKPAKDNYLKE